MSEHHPDDTGAVLPGTRRRRRSRVPGCLAVLLALAVIGGGGYLVAQRGLDFVREKLADAPDYAGPGSGRVMVQVRSGDTATVICRELKDKEVVASVDACISAADDNPRSSGIQVGYYEVKRKMAAADALGLLVDPANLVTTRVTIPEGLRVSEIVASLAKQTKKPKAAFTKALADPQDLGLPSYAKGNPEGYLFPSTYSFGPKDTPRDMLAAMVTRWQQAADDVRLERAAQRLGYTPEQLMTVASLVQSEARGDDMPKVARVIYNRLSSKETGGLLQIDATVNYAAGNSLGAVPTSADLAIDSPYNTYQNPGLPPTPIEAPGDAALRAATRPANGPWFYYVTVNLRTGLTKFTDSYSQFLTYKNELRQYCETESQGAC